MKKLADIGVLGIGVMGRSIALNFADNGGYTVALYNRTHSKVEDLITSEDAQGLKFVASESIQEFVASLELPRKIFLMVSAGDMVDKTIEKLLPYLSEGDIVIDGGNSFFEDTRRRELELRDKSLHFFGVGVSGGEEGARNGASIMPGGNSQAYELIKPFLESIAAEYEGTPCCSYIGSDGAGHYVKMVHNGIEYADMQLIAEAYYIFRNYLKLEYTEISDIFTLWNERALGGFLIEITADILRKNDPESSKPMLDMILDRAGQKGTGKWTSQAALDLGVAAPTIAEAVFARYSSSDLEERYMAAKLFPVYVPEFTGNKKELIEAVYDSLLASKIVAYAQGFKLMTTAAARYGWELDYVSISSIWRNGCIIRAKMLNDIARAYTNDAGLINLLLAPEFDDIIKKCESNWRLIVAESLKTALPVPCFASALNYYLALRSERLWTDMIQAQRDYFGAHTFERVDKPEGEFFHVEW